jgi:stringent starvation protein B
MNNRDFNREKYVCATSILNTNNSVFIHLNPRHTGVKVPASFLYQDYMVLQFGHDMPIPIPDLNVDNKFISGTLSFKGVPFLCMIPWEAVFAIVGDSSKGLVWDDDVPISAKGTMNSINEKQNKPSTVIQKSISNPKQDSSSSNKKPKKELPPYLRVIK